MLFFDKSKKGTRLWLISNLRRRGFHPGEGRGGEGRERLGKGENVARGMDEGQHSLGGSERGVRATAD